MRIDKAEVIVTSPDRNFVTLRLTTDEGLVGLGDATLNGRELAVVSYLSEHVVPLLIGRDAEPHRGHLAVPLPERLLAARTGDHGGDRRGRHGALGHQGQGRRDAGVPTARRRIRARPAGLRSRVGQVQQRAVRHVRAHQEQGYKAIRMQTGVPGLKSIYGIASNADFVARRRVRYDHEPAQRGAPDRGGLGHPHLPAPPAQRVRGGAQRVRARAAAAARRAPPA